MAIPRDHVRIFLKLLAVWLVLMVPGVFYIGLWRWTRAVALATVGLVAVFIIWEVTFGRSGG